jgi:hypothetical protein
MRLSSMRNAMITKRTVRTSAFIVAILTGCSGGGNASLPGLTRFATVEFPVNDSLAGLTPLDLVVEVVEHRPYDYVEADLAEAVRTGLVHGLLQSAARSRGFGVPKARLGL